MEKSKCPQCGSTLGNGVAVCGECGYELKELNNKEYCTPQEEQRGRKNVYTILTMFLVVVGGVALLMFTGLLPNPIKSGSIAAIVNGAKIPISEVDQKIEAYKKISGQGGKMDSSSPAGKTAMAQIRMQILNSLIQEKILLTEAAKEKITVSQQEIVDRIASIKKELNLSDADFENFLKNHGMSPTSFEKRIEKDALINKLIVKATQEKGLTRDAWFDELNAKAKVEIFAK
jgi:parvulin-like peptidyl-prolyl isomerase